MSFGVDQRTPTYSFILLVLGRVNEPPKLHIDMDLYSQDQGNLQKDELELTDTDMVDGSCTEFAIELFGAEAPQVVDGEWPQMQHVIAGKGIPLLYDHHLGSQERQVDGCTKATGSSPNYQTLRVGACFPLLVVLMAASFIQFGPQGFGFPVIELGLELVIEGTIVLGL